MIFSFFKQLVKEDFDKKDKELINKLGFIINPAFQNLSSILSRNLTWEDNFAAVVKVITITVDASGNPTSSTSFKVDLKTPVRNLWVTRAENQANTTHFPVTAPFITWSQKDDQIIINNVCGLQANEKYQLRIIVTI